MRILKPVLLLAGILFAGTTYAEGNKFLIRGKIPEVQSGQMILLATTVRGMDTLAQVPIENGTFRMEGVIAGPVVALIAVANYQGGFVFLLDTDKPYTMELYQKKKSCIEGGKLQQELVEYQNQIEQANGEIKTLKGQIADAVQQKHYRTKKELEDKLANYQAEVRQKLQVIVNRNKDNLFAAYIQTAGLEQVTDLNVLKGKYAQLSEKARQTVPGRILAMRVAELEKIKVGSVAPNFTLSTPEGKSVSLYEVKGKIKIIDFWASWCGPCRMENPNMVKLYQDFKDKGLSVISVSLDTQKDKWTEAIEKDGMPWIHVSSLKGWKSEVVKIYGIDAVPSIFVLDANNCIIAKELRGEKLRVFVEKSLAL